MSNVKIEIVPADDGTCNLVVDGRFALNLPGKDAEVFAIYPSVPTAEQAKWLLERAVQVANEQPRTAPSP